MVSFPVTIRTAFNVTDADIQIYKYPMYQVGNETSFTSAYYSKKSAQEGLLIKTYQSDLFNNWLNSEQIDNINLRSAVDVSSGLLNIETLIMAKKVYNYLNRIQVSGGTVADWQKATYDVEGFTLAENPMYVGGITEDLSFEEVFSNSSTEGQPLGTLAGKGRMVGNRKGGKVKVRVNEPSDRDWET